MSQKMWFTTANCRAKIISTGTTLYFNLFQACLPTRHNGVENRDKAYAYDSCYTPIKERMVLKTKRNHTNEIVKLSFIVFHKSVCHVAKDVVHDIVF